MDFDDAKENIQPLATGRNASILQASLHESPQKLLAQRRDLEQAIHKYSGDDPLEPWYTYISWIEQSFPSGGKESGLEEVLTKCISRFESEERYYQDRRMIKLYMKFLDNHKHPTECYQQLFNAGIGTMVADFYICWAYYYDLCGNTRKADEIFRRGIACRAQPLEELQEAHQHFGFTVAQRLMYQDDEDVKESSNRQLQERRLALTSLRGHRRKAVVGSIRTGTAVKSYTPGTVQLDAPSTSRQCNARVSVFHDENASPNLPESLQTPVEPPVETAAPEDGKSVVRSIIDAARNQENQKEPGPWNKALDKKKSGKLFSKSVRPVELGFEILEDDAMAGDAAGSTSGTPLQPPITEGVRNYNQSFKYPANFASRNLPQPEWHTPVTIESEADARAWAQYNKCLLYPRPNMEFQPEELRAYYWLKRRGITNAFTQKRDVAWRTRDPQANVRQYPNFAKHSRPQKLDELDAYFKPERKPHMVVAFGELYDADTKEEYQWEELIARRLRRNETIATVADMEETVCMPSERVQRRKSFFPLRKSIAPRALPTQKQVAHLTTEPDVKRDQEQAGSVSSAVVKDWEEEVKPKALKARDSLAVHRKEQREKGQSTAVGLSKGLKLLDVFEEITRPAAVDPVAEQPVEQKATLKLAQSTNHKEIVFQSAASTLTASSASSCVAMSKVDTSKGQSTQLKPTESASTAEAARKDNGPLNVFDDNTSLSTGSCRTKSTEGAATVPQKDNAPFEVFEDTTSLPAGACVAPYADVGKPVPVAIVAPSKESLPFEIYEDTTTGFTTAAIASSTRCQDVVASSDFKFKTPAPPITGVKSGKLPFEIYTEEAAVEQENVENAGGGYFDAEETCSTQTFNVFLRMQSVSTPKVPQNVAPRQFGVVLESTAAMAREQANDQESLKHGDAPDNAEIAENVVAGSAITQYSPLQPKQLSTIMETSEHGTTQGTHTTGGTSTKSTISSPETEGEQQPARLIMPHAELEPLQEQSRENSTLAVIASMENIKLHSSVPTREAAHADAEMRDLALGKQPPQPSVPATPADGRLQLGAASQRPPMGSLNFSIFEDERTDVLKPKQAGDFTRIDEREDTAAGYAVRSVRFQEDKTETISKMLLSSRQYVPFQEDKTETISKMLLAPPAAARFEEDKTETLPRMPLQAPTLPAQASCATNLDESFEFFGESPPLKNRFKSNADVYMGFADTPSPLAKRFCEKDTPQAPAPNVEKRTDRSAAKIQMQLFEDELGMLADPKPLGGVVTSSVGSVQKSAIKPAFKSHLRDSFLPDFSLIEETQPQPAENVSAKKCAGKSLNVTKSQLSTSYLKDFSAIMDSQAMGEQATQHQVVKLPTTKATHGDSFLKDFSTIMDSQPAVKIAELGQQRAAAKDSSGQLLMNDSAMVMSSQPEKSERLQAGKSQPARASLGDSYLKDFSIIMDSQPQEFGASWRHNKSAKQKTVPTAAISQVAEKSNLGASYLKDFSMSLSKQTDKRQATLQEMAKSTLGTSFFNDFSMAINPQPAKSNLGTSYLEDFSMVMDSQPPNLSAMWRPNKSISRKTVTPQAAKSNMGDSYLKDISAIVETQPLKNEILWHQKKSAAQKSTGLKDLPGVPHPQEQLNTSASNAQKANSLLKALNETKRQHESAQRPSKLKPPTKLSFLETFKAAGASERSATASNVPLRRSGEQCFELNAETEMFATNNSMIKNSTWLPQHEQSCNLAQFKEQSLHIKAEPVQSRDSIEAAFKLPLPPPPPTTVANEAQNSMQSAYSKQPNFASVSVNKTESEAHVATALDDGELAEVDDNAELSIYYKHTPKTPTIEQHSWEGEELPLTSPTSNTFLHADSDLNQTQQIIDHMCGGPNINPNVNPFNNLLLSAFLGQIDFTKYIEELPNCQLVRNISRLHASTLVKVCDKEFNVLKLVDEGAYGVVYCGIDKKSGKKYALKQERPPNFWEYYICLEVQSRLHIDEMLSAYMSVDYALIGNNASILISSFSTHGSLINVCNKVKKSTMKNVDEYVVMLLTCELLDIIDHLHAVSIIHADIKANNFLLMKKLSYPGTDYALQLIDFGVAIDMKLFKAGQTFNYVHTDNAFKCVEMREDRPWTYQLDLYGLAGVIHVLLFGKYMEIAKRTNGTWMHKTHVPRYFNKALWETIFTTLLNVRDCSSMPNLQQLRALLKEEVAEKEKFVHRKVCDFNSALTA